MYIYLMNLKYFLITMFYLYMTLIYNILLKSQTNTPICLSTYINSYRSMNISNIFLPISSNKTNNLLDNKIYSDDSESFSTELLSFLQNPCDEASNSPTLSPVSTNNISINYITNQQSSYIT